MPETNRKFYELFHDDLEDRQEFERRLGKFEHQRFGKDRPRVNNDPWPNASNYRRKKSDEIIEQKKAFYSQVIHSSQYIANFKALIPQNLDFADLNEAYFDYQTKEKTDFERQSVYCLDKGLQDGTSYMKITYDLNKGIPVYKWIENLMIIVPSRTLQLEDATRIAHVIQMSEKEAKKRFGHLPKFDQLLKSAMTTSTDEGQMVNDTVNRERDRYERRGINVSARNMFVVWEIHYQDESNPNLKRMRTICPDDPDFDFLDDREYPYTDSDGVQRYMFEQFRREWLSPDIYSSRGIPEIVWEEEFLLTAVARMKHNTMTLVNMPVFTSDVSLPPGSTNNFSCIPGSFLPNNMQPIQFPSPPISWDQETQNVESIVDRRMTSANASSTDNTIYTGGTGNKTARQVSYEAGVQTLAVNYETMPWKKFMRSVLRQGWQRTAQFKPQSLTFYMQNTLRQLPVEALNGEFDIVLSWSVDNINKEFNIQQSRMLWQDSLQMRAPQLIEKTWKNYVNQMVPGSGGEYEIDPEALQQDAVEEVANEIDIMVSTGFPVRPKESIDPYTAVTTTMQYIQAEQHRGQPVPQDRLYLLTGYMQAYREQLKKTNPQQYQQLMEELNALDIQNRQQQAINAQNLQALQNQLAGAQAQGQQLPVNVPREAIEQPPTPQAPQL